MRGLTEKRDTILEVLRKRSVSEIRASISDLAPNEIASLIPTISTPEDRALLFRVLPREIATETFEYLPHRDQKELTESLANEEVALILESMADDDRTRFFEELPSGVAQRLLLLLSESERRKATLLLGYPEDSVGRLMTPHYVMVRPHWTVQQALEHIRKFGKDSETLTMVYVVNERGVLIDDIRMRLFLLASPETRVTDLMNNRFVALKATDSQEDAVSVFREADLPALPVTDADGALIGVVTADDILDIAEQEATEDIQKFGGLEALELPYVETPFLSLIKKRAGWLVILFIGEMLTASAMGYFEHEIAQAVVLALFVPLIISSGGNSGSQAATLVIRAMALKEISLRDWFWVIRREIFSGLSLGIILGSIGYLRITLWQKLGFFNYSEHWPLVALTIFLSLVAIVMWGTVSGSMIPFVMRRVGLDPATSSAPFVATLVDVTGIVIYFSIAAIVLRGTLL
ncbi:magnesium transporter [Leptolyngbya sp. 7M]|uniref:magnesium transporter n=1 Tax=Leptolyngbya sp. 7M TaxID=2812896 RepID=UPI001B8CDF7A|nr:magnesium transporter [Leptolyngbya sp. 7M]QYO65967.1 magnesium transporter [Leptolyngbya sp. 7M]